MKSGIEIGINLLFWILSTWLIVTGFSIESQEIEITEGVETLRIVRNQGIINKLILVVSISFLLFYLNFWLFSKRQLNGNLKRLFFTSGLMLIGAFGIFYLLETFGIAHFALRIPNSLSGGIFLFYYTVSIAYGLGRAFIRIERAQKDMQVEKKQAELQLLRNQLQPHFLFNVLNNLLAMVDLKHNPQLGNAIDQLSSLLRYVIHETDHGQVSIEKELAFIKSYIELQLLRFEPNEVDCQLIINGDYDQQLVEPGLFIPFIENAFKYGAAPEEKSSIHISFDLRKNKQIQFQITNPFYPDLQHQVGNGTGLASVKKRLELIYEQQYMLEIKQEDQFTVQLKLITDEDDNRR